MRKVITTTVLAMLLGVTGVSLSACDQGNNGNRNAPDAAPTNPSQTAPNSMPDKPNQTAPSGMPDNPNQTKPGGNMSGGSAPENQNGLGS